LHFTGDLSYLLISTGFDIFHSFTWASTPGRPGGIFMKKTAFVLCFICLMAIMGCAASHYTLGQRHLKAEQFDEALAEFEMAKETQPDNPKILRDIGITYYHKLNFQNAIDYLLQAFLLDSTDGRTLFYLGTAFEINKKYDMAIDIYSRYVDVNPTSGIRGSIEGRLEKLIRQQMEAEALQALADESALDTEMIPDSTVAVLYFKNMGNNRDLDPIQKGLADMIITDLSKVKTLKVIERIRLQKLMEEMGMGMTGIVDEKTAPRVGKLLGASQLIKGTYTPLTGDKIRIDAELIPVKTEGAFQSSPEVDLLENLFKLEKNLVFSLIDRMDIQLSQEERDAIEVIPTENLLAFMAYCHALDYEDRGMYEQSAEFYREALMHDPGFLQAGEKLKVSENLISGSGEISELEQKVAGETDEVTTAETEIPESAENEPEIETAMEPASIPAQTSVMDQLIHTSAVLDQGFLPGIDSREPAQEQSQPSFGGTANFKIVIPLPPAEKSGGTP
jgi:tetratricopeptide (TPR) repeat protein